MKISIVAVGRVKTGPKTQLIAEYSKRLPWQISIIEVEEKRPLSRNEKIESEGTKLLAAIPKGHFIVAMDKAGENLSSEALAANLERWNSDHQGIAFLIGGADGLSKTALLKTNYKLSFGSMTWPHMLARVMLVEQLYRAFAIQQSHPYHK